MLREIYMRDSTDPHYDPDTLEQSNEIETLLGEIRMILFTKQGEVMGSYNFGFNLEDNLFLLNVNTSALKEKIQEAIYMYCPDASTYDVKVDVQFFKGSVRDICLIDIIINGEKKMGILVK